MHSNKSDFVSCVVEFQNFRIFSTVLYKHVFLIIYNLYSTIYIYPAIIFKHANFFLITNIFSTYYFLVNT